MTVTLIDQDTGQFVDLAIDSEGRLEVVISSGISIVGDVNVDDVAVSSIAAGDNNIGNVDIVSLPGTTESDIGSILTALQGTLITRNVVSAGQLSGQIVVSGAGTAVQGPNVVGTNGFYVRALDDNLAQVFVGNDGANDVTSANGYELSPGESIVLHIANINESWVDAIVDNDGICWIKA